MPLNCWVVFPSATTSKANDAIDAWSAQGYHTLVYQDIGAEPCTADIVRLGNFPGYYRVINALVEDAMCEGADIVTCAGDDMLPDPHATAQDIGKFYLTVFPQGNGVLQACGDRQGMDAAGVPAAARICGSPTFGREWIARSYEGAGPFWNGYHSFYGDEDLKEVAENLGLLHMAPQYTFLHKHWSWGHMPRQSYQQRNSDQHWESDAALFSQRKAAQFPQSKMLAT
jgi:hypothetical protein